MDDITQQGSMPEYIQEQALAPGMIFHDYRIISLLGQGGSGIVFLAEQQHPVQRKVAIKLLKAGFSDNRSLLRFQVEMQTLAQMDHTNIARVYKVGDHNGTPFFAMEYVQGEPVLEFCDKHKFTIPQRLELFQNILDSVQHAHQKGIIHRDIKPNNILVKMQDEKPVPKLIDFGIAKADDFNSKEFGKALTREGVAVGTPSYMSPEQFEGSQNVDTRTDIYALGVVLHQLLVGVLPVDFLNQPFYKALKGLFEDMPQSLAKKYESTGTDREEIARQRATVQAELGLTVRGDLNLIVQKAISKEKEARYATALDFKQDIRNYLGNWPLIAHIPSSGYRFRKFIQRHWVGTLATILLLMSLILGIAGTTYQYIRAKAAREDALLENKKSEAVLRFMDNMLSSAHAMERGKDVKVIELLNDAVSQLEEKKGMNPSVECIVRVSLSETFGNLGETGRAITLLEEGLKRVTPLLGGEDRNILLMRMTLAQSFWLEGRLGKAESLIREVIDVEERVFAPNDEDLLSAKNNLAGILWERGDADGALDLIKEVYLMVKENKGPTHKETLILEGNLASALLSVGKIQEGRKVMQSVMNTLLTLDPVPYGSYLESKNSLAVSYIREDPQKAVALEKEAVESAWQHFGKDPVTFNFIHNLGFFYHRQGMWKQSAENYQIAFEGIAEITGSNSIKTLRTEVYYITALTYSGDQERASSLLQNRKAHGWDDDSEYTIGFLRNCVLLNKWDWAESVLKDPENQDPTGLEWELLRALVKTKADPEKTLSALAPKLEQFQKDLAVDQVDSVLPPFIAMNYSKYKNDAWYLALNL